METLIKGRWHNLYKRYTDERRWGETETMLDPLTQRTTNRQRCCHSHPAIAVLSLT